MSHSLALAETLSLSLSQIVGTIIYGCFVSGGLRIERSCLCGSWLFLNIVLNKELTAAAGLKRQLFKNARAAARRRPLA